VAYEGLGRSIDLFVWEDIPGALLNIAVSETSTLVITFTGEVTAPNGARLWMRPRVDDLSTNPIDTVLAGDTNWGTHSATFIKTEVAPGSHQVEIQWRAWEGTVYMEAWTLAVYAYPS
jgi:hypothetical protein